MHACILRFLIYLLLVIIFFRIAPSLILLGSCRVTKNTRNGSVWQLTRYLTEGPSAGSRPRDKRGARSSRPLNEGGGGVGSVSKIFFSAFRALVWSTNKGGFCGCGGAQAKPAIGLFEKNGNLFSSLLMKKGPFCPLPSSRRTASYSSHLNDGNRRRLG